MTNIFEPAKVIAFILHSGDSIAEPIKNALESEFGPIEYKGSPVVFDHTQYYHSEMGENLFRTLIGFSGLVSAEVGADLKVRAMQVEQSFLRSNSGRSINIDIGLMDSDKVVLPSVKKGPFKIYNGQGIWLDMVLTYAKGQFSATSWAFSDFKSGVYQKDLMRVREYLRKELKASSKQ